MRADFQLQLAAQHQMMMGQQQELMRQLSEQNSIMLNMGRPMSPRPALSVSTVGSYGEMEPGPNSSDSYDPTSTAMSSHTSPQTSAQNPFPTFSSRHSISGGPDLLSPTRPFPGAHRPVLTDNDFIRTWTLEVHYHYITLPSQSNPTSPNPSPGGEIGGYMCRRCPHLDPSMDDGNPNKRKFGFYKASRDKPAAITKRAREHSLRHFRENREGENGGKGKHRRRKSEGDMKRPEYLQENNGTTGAKTEDEGGSTNGAFSSSSRETSPATDFKYQHQRYDPPL
ncbi:hypothetical protein P7C70_g9492, partial [Phenoliferia sp. Uapishka_3]